MSQEPHSVRKVSNLELIGREIISADQWDRVRKPVISAFIIFHALLNCAYMFNHHPYIFEINRFFHGYYYFLGLDQDFGVFSPPRSQNCHMTAVITYKDGTTRIWNSPRMERLGFIEKVPKERYRKFFDDNSSWENLSILWPDIARYIARTNYNREDNPPVAVSLLRFSSKIPPPPASAKDWANLKANPPQFETYPLSTTRIKSEDLRP